MATTMEDIIYDEMLDSLCAEEIMKKAAGAQCIYIFVEGESEEAIFQMLLEDCGLDFKTHGIVIANYNGIGNLRNSIRLLRKTLSHDRPIIMTYDDDRPGKREAQHIDDELITAFKIPQTPVVKYPDGSDGGSLEEAFPPELFIESSFKCDVILNSNENIKSDFSAIFDAKKPWFAQLASFVSSINMKAGSINKVRLAEHMAESCNPIPDTFKKLAELALKLREQHPVKSPNDVDLSFLNSR
ncbi:TOPRIM nucleotidyl transferase/hydrolase domain-containing protein [Pseudomonas sp. ACM7]|uniref:TOPRIM nucleotidyl transferase/hydrolase domain-containing protein n=1 Tax=Pseudomonas sp. ACM7 TaxID=2052956 RepID=UPI0010128527|nr:TOPRIM nucleotidyl transferase/hydrolase domain-containing protein [Pseudomonas sp. ACM7]QAY91249.1 hypothetical protein CUN63_15505 [Pseudomonas sp. ACM7]